jgi:glucose/arabinose dehydrogenase
MLKFKMMKNRLKISWIASIVFVIFLLVLFFKSTTYKSFFSHGENDEIAATRNPNFVSQQIENQYKSGDLNAPSRDVETSVIPLRLTFEKMADYGEFAVEGGSLSASDIGLFIMDRMGNLYIKDDVVTRVKIPPINNNIQAYILSGANLNSNEMRVHSVAFYEREKKLYVCYTKYLSDGQHQLVVDAVKIDTLKKESIGDWVNIYTSQTVSASQSSNGAGGRLLIDKNKIFLSIGYPNSIGYPREWEKGGWHTGDANLANSQDAKSSFGKIFSIDLFSNAVSLVSMGHRNPQGLAISNTNQLFSVEHGPQGGDEVNLIKKGKNYGWPITTYGTRYGTFNYEWSTRSKTNDNGFEEPLFSFVPSIGASSIYFVNNFYPQWNGDLLIGSLKAQTVYRLHLGKSKNVIFSEPIWIGHRVRDISRHQPNVINILTDDGFLASLTVDADALHKNVKGNGLTLEPALKVCQTCHGFESTTPNSMAPTLRGLLNRKIGSDNFDKYSQSLKSKDGVWTQENLEDFINNPQKFAPGTAMPKLGLSKSEVRNIVTILTKK